MKEQYRDEGLETIHIYLLRENAPPVIDAAPEREQEKPHPGSNQWGIVYCASIGLLFALLPLVAIIAASLFPPYDMIVSKTLALTLSLHPVANQVQLYPFPIITKTKQATVKATGRVQESATRAEGLITFYNGLFTSQLVPTGTVLTGKDGVSIVTSEPALIPAATPTTPPTYGTISVMAHSERLGPTGNIVANDIDRACCGPSILVQNLDTFSGGANAREVTVVMQSDITHTAVTLKAELGQAAQDQAQSEVQAGQQLLPLQCTISTKANHQAGDQAQEVTITVSEQCLPLAYTMASVQRQVTAVLARSLPLAYQFARLSIIVLNTGEIDIHKGTAALTVHVTAFLQVIHSTRRR